MLVVAACENGSREYKNFHNLRHIITYWCTIPKLQLGPHFEPGQEYLYQDDNEYPSMILKYIFEI
jgi:hypothetical protein